MQRTAAPVEPLLSLAGDAGSLSLLAEALIEQSHLPGPRANLGLASAFAHAVAAAGPSPALVERLMQWAAIGPAAAPSGTPSEYLPFVAVQTLGALYLGLDPSERGDVLWTIKAAARSPRWRTREAAAMAFQHIGERSFDELEAIFARWMPTADCLEWRNMLAALAHPPMLTHTSRVYFCLQVTEGALRRVKATADVLRKLEPFRVLRKGLDYAPSVFVAALPDEGFALLRRWAACTDPDIRQILRANLRKSRLTAPCPVQVREVLGLLEPH